MSNSQDRRRRWASIALPSGYTGEIWLDSTFGEWEWEITARNSDTFLAVGIAPSYWEAFQSILETAKLWGSSKLEVTLRTPGQESLHLDLNGGVSVYR